MFDSAYWPGHLIIRSIDRRLPLFRTEADAFVKSACLWKAFHCGINCYSELNPACLETFVFLETCLSSWLDYLAIQLSSLQQAYPLHHAGSLRDKKTGAVLLSINRQEQMAASRLTGQHGDQLICKQALVPLFAGHGSSVRCIWDKRGFRVKIFSLP